MKKLGFVIGFVGIIVSLSASAAEKIIASCDANNGNSQIQRIIILKRTNQLIARVLRFDSSSAEETTLTVLSQLPNGTKYTALSEEDEGYLFYSPPTGHSLPLMAVVGDGTIDTLICMKLAN